MTRSKSVTLRRRVLIALALMSLGTLGIGSLATAITGNYLLGRIDDSLRRSPLGNPQLAGSPAIITPIDPCVVSQVVADAVVVIADPNGQSRSVCEGQPTPQIDFAKLGLSIGESSEPFIGSDSSGANFRLIVRKFPFGYVGIGVPLAPTERTVRRVAAVQLGATLVSIFGAAAVVLWLLRRGVRPLDQMVATADRIAAGDRSTRVDVSGHEADEIGKLGNALNGMLDQLGQSMHNLEQSQNRLRRFVQDASHELRTPLTSIRGYTELHRGGMLADAAATNDAMDRIHHESVRMSDMVNDMLQLANFDEEPSLRLVPTNLVGLVQATVVDARAVDPRFPVSVSATHSAIEATLDANSFQQVVSNLLANVRAHTPPETGTDIAISVDAHGPVVVIRDHGPGIDPAVIGEVFERFVQASPSRHRSGGGAGLGLSIARSIVAAHHGTIEVENHPEGGTQFTIRLPHSAREVRA